MTANNIWQWFQENEASTGGVTDKIQNYLTAAGYTGATNEALYRWLGARGYEGSLADRIYQFEYFNTFRYIDISAKLVLEKFGTDAHVWIPGIGYFNGLQAGNYIDSAGTQAGLVDNPVGLVMDAEGSLGAELVTNGNFSNGLTSWVVQQPTAGSVAVLAGECRFNSTDGSLAYIQQSICTVGRTYSVNLNVVNVSSGLLAISDGSANYITFNTTGAKSFVFVATSSVFQVKRVSGVTDITIDNISVREVTGAITATQGTTANKPILRRGAVNLFPYGQTTQGAPSNRAAWIVSQGYGGSGTPLNTTGSSAVSGAGIGYWEFTVNATAVSTNRLLVDWGAINGAASTRQPVVAAATYTASMYIAVQGSITSSNNYVTPSILWYTSGNVFISQSSGVQVSASSTFGNTRLVVTGTAPATAAFAQIRADFSEGMVIGSVANATVQIGGAQLELGSTASEYIPTTTAAASSSSGDYYWQFDGSNDSLALSSVPFVATDDLCVVLAARTNEQAATARTAFGFSGAAGQRMAMIYNESGYWYLRFVDDAAATYAIQTTTQLSADSIRVVSARKSSNVRILRLNGAQEATSNTPVGTTTVTGGSIGARDAASAAPYLGSIYPVIAIKGTVSDADLLVLERWVASLSGVSI